MKQRLNKYQLQFYIIKYAIWSLLKYYEDLFCLYAPDCPDDFLLGLNVDASDVTHLICKVEKCTDYGCPYGTAQMLRMMNEFLNIVLLRKQQYSCLAPYFEDGCLYDCICLHEITEEDGCLHLEFIYVDSRAALQSAYRDEAAQYVLDGDSL